MAYTTFTDSRGTTITNYGYLVSIWNKLKSHGLSDISVASLMGNFYAESYCVPYIVQNNLSPPFSYSINYTNNVDNGTISENDFVYHGPNGGGYGLAQWTYKTRKQKLYNLKNSGAYPSIGNYVLACDMVWVELNSSDFTNVYNYLFSTHTFFEKVKYVMLYYENPDDISSGAQETRFDYAHAIYEYMQGDTPPTDPPDDGSGTGGGNGGGNNPVSTRGYFNKRHGKMWMYMKQRYFNRRTGQWQ